jgi:5-methylcytosine-specific restriction endonuclease McrA
MTWKAPPGWRKLRAKVFATKGRACWWCGRTATTVDHVLPVVLGGGHGLDNLVPACSRCNYGRGASLGNRMRAGTLARAAVPSSRRW